MKKNTLIILCMLFAFLFCGFDSYSEDEPTIYPLHFTSSLEEYITEMPDVCYDTPASENGLAGNVYSVTGIMTEIIPEEETPDGVPTVFSVSTPVSQVYYTIMDPDFVERTTGKDYARDLFDSTMDYTLPEIGEFVTVYGIYSGYSSVYEGPLFYFGIDEFVHECVVRDSDSSSNPSPAPTEPLYSNNIDDYTLIDAKEIPTGKYSDTEVALEGVVDNHISDSGDCSFTLWIKSGNTYLYDNGSFRGIEEGTPEEIFQNAKDGDIIRFATKIYDDNSFGTTTVYAAEIVGNTDLTSVHDSYKADCEPIDYNGASRNPDQYEGNMCFVSGTIFQIVDEGSSMAEYIVETADGLVYLNWYENEDTRGSRFLEGDSVNIYGQYDGLETYDSLVKENTIPRVIVNLIELI